ncbi:MAG: MFS transporter [Acidimicrobiales bacterium]
MPRHPLSDFRPAVRTALPWILVMRFLNNTGNRFPYSFLGALSRGTGFSVEGIGALLALRDLSGLSAPLVGKLADTRGTERLMRTGAFCSVLALLFSSVGAWPFVIGSLAFGLAKVLFDIAMNSWIGHEVTYEMRGRAVGMTELTWAGAAIVGIPICGLLIDNLNWRAAPAVLGLAAIPGALGVRRTLADSDGHSTQAGGRLRLTRPVVLTSVAVAAVSLSCQYVVVGHGLWLEDTYGFSPSTVGFAVISIGVVEATATTLSARFTDQVGKRRSMLAGTTVQVIAISALAIFPSPPIGLGLIGLATAFLRIRVCLRFVAAAYRRTQPVGSRRRHRRRNRTRDARSGDRRSRGASCTNSAASGLR